MTTIAAIAIRPEHRPYVEKCLQKLRSQRKYRPLQKPEYQAMRDLRSECNSADEEVI